MKPFISLILLLFSVLTFAQNENQTSSTRKFTDNARFCRVNADWSTTAEFSSGVEEYVNFNPVEIIDLKSGEKRKALQIEMFVKNPDVYKTVWLDLDEVKDFISFLEKNLISNLENKSNDTSAEFIFKAREMSFSYFVYGKEKRITVKVNSYDNNTIQSFSFSTKTQSDKIPKLLAVLTKMMPK